MVPGPVFGVEIRSTSRRVRYFAARAGLAMVLLALLAVRYASLPELDRFSSHFITGFAQSTFRAIAAAQAFVVIAMTPALIAPIIAEERTRRTLDYLLASHLTSAEIVLGKLAARMLHVFGFLLVGLPICSALTLFGGVAPADVVMVYAVTAASALFVGGLSILTSVLARGPREAVFTAYGLTAFWLCIAPVLEGPIVQLWPTLSQIIDPVVHVLASFNPLHVTPDSWISMSAILAMSGVVLALLGTAALRSASRGRAKTRLARASRRLFPRTPVADDSMHWKETRTQRPATVAGAIIKGFLILFVIGLAIMSATAAYPAFAETVKIGYMTTSYSAARQQFNLFVRLAGAILYLLALLTATATAAGAITSEREADTWTGIVASPLSAREILRAKRAGVYRLIRPLVAAMLALWFLGVLSGAVHPVGFILVASIVPIYLVAATALGLFASLACRSTARALVVAILATSVLHGGYLLCCVPITPRSPIVALGCTPVLVVLAPVSYEDMYRSFRVGGIAGGGPDGVVETFFLSILAYIVVALALNWAAAKSFDELEDRPSSETPNRGSSDPESNNDPVAS